MIRLRDEEMVDGIFHNEFDIIWNSHFIRFSSILICNRDILSVDTDSVSTDKIFLFLFESHILQATLNFVKTQIIRNSYAII